MLKLERFVWTNSPILSSPSFHKRHSDGAHPRQLINGFKALRHWLWKQCSELLVVENFQVTSGWNFANCRRMPSIARVAVRTLNENTRVAETLGEDFAADIVKSNTFPDVSSRLLYNFIAIHVRQKSEAEALGVWWIGEAVDGDWRLRRMESLADAQIELVVADRAPEGWILVHHWCSLERLWGRQMRETWNDPYVWIMLFAISSANARQNRLITNNKLTQVIILIHWVAVLGHVAGRRSLRRWYSNTCNTAGIHDVDARVIWYLCHCCIHCCVAS